MKTIRHLALATALCCTLLAPALGDDLYVRNRLFKGGVSSVNGGLWVELEPFAAALKLQAKKTANGAFVLSASGNSAEPEGAKPGMVWVNDTLVPSQDVDGKLYVPLEQVAQLLGAKIVKNHDLQTIDVNLMDGSTLGGGSWGANLEEQKAKEAEEAAARKAAKVPAHSLRLYGQITLPGADQVGLFTGGSANAPYKTGTVKPDGSYVLDIDFEKDMHQFQPGLLITDIRFFKDGAFDMLHGRCNFLYYYKDTGRVVLEPYETGQKFDVQGNKYEFREQY